MSAFNGYQTSTMNFQTFSQVAFAFRVTPGLLATGLVYALAMGFIGGLFPAIRAARLPIPTALRELCSAKKVVPFPFILIAERPKRITRECRA